jgi:hypothetical protein
MSDKLDLMLEGEFEKVARAFRCITVELKKLKDENMELKKKLEACETIISSFHDLNPKKDLVECSEKFSKEALEEGLSKIGRDALEESDSHTGQWFKMHSKGETEKLDFPHAPEECGFPYHVEYKPKFKVGDSVYVTCTWCAHYGYGAGKVTSYDPDIDKYGVLFSDMHRPVGVFGADLSYDNPCKQSENEPKFKVGDRVKVINKDRESASRIGVLSEVFKVGGQIGYRVTGLYDTPELSPSFAESELELISKAIGPQIQNGR